MDGIGPQVPARPQLLAGLETDFSDNRRGTRNVWSLIGCGGRRCAARPGIQKHRPILTDGGGAEKETERKRKDNQA